MNLELEKSEIESLGLDERITYATEKMIEVANELAAAGGFSGAAYECLKGAYVVREFNIGKLGGRILDYKDLLDPIKLDRIKYDFCQLEKKLAQEAERLLFTTKNPTDEQVELWTHYIEKARHN